MSSLLPVAVDAMGGDDAPDVVVRGALAAAEAGVRVLLVGDPERLKPLLPRGSDVEIHPAFEQVGMADRPTAVLKRPDNSIARALELVRDGKAAAAVSCGNTGAVLVGAKMLLGTLSGVDRPAIATLLPRMDGGRVVMLDAGANVDCRPEQLCRFAQLGVAYARTLGVENPRVGLLSNGEEDDKGNGLVRATLPLLRELPFDVVGNVEPTAAMAGACDVLVCDGFVGNVLLKAVEAAAETVLHFIREEILARPTGRAGAWLMQRAVGNFREKLDWDAHGGALLLGTSGVVVVGHGRANVAAVKAAVLLADQAARHGVLPAVKRQLEA